MALNEGCHAVFLLVQEHFVMKGMWLPRWWVSVYAWPLWINKTKTHKQPKTPSPNPTNKPNHKQNSCINSVQKGIVTRFIKYCREENQQRANKTCCFPYASHEMIGYLHHVGQILHSCTPIILLPTEGNAMLWACYQTRTWSSVCRLSDSMLYDFYKELKIFSLHVHVRQVFCLF